MSAHFVFAVALLVAVACAAPAINAYPIRRAACSGGVGMVDPANAEGLKFAQPDSNGHCYEVDLVSNDKTTWKVRQAEGAGSRCTLAIFSSSSETILSLGDYQTSANCEINFGGGTSSLGCQTTDKTRGTVLTMYESASSTPVTASITEPTACSYRVTLTGPIGSFEPPTSTPTQALLVVTAHAHQYQSWGGSNRDTGDQGAAVQIPPMAAAPFGWAGLSQPPGQAQLPAAAATLKAVCHREGNEGGRGCTEACNSWTDMAAELNADNAAYTSSMGGRVSIGRRISDCSGNTNCEFRSGKDDRLPISSRGMCNRLYWSVLSAPKYAPQKGIAPQPDYSVPLAFYSDHHGNRL